jgi:hypothetical protein
MFIVNAQPLSVSIIVSQISAVFLSILLEKKVAHSAG